MKKIYEKRNALFFLPLHNLVGTGGASYIRLNPPVNWIQLVCQYLCSFIYLFIGIKTYIYRVRSRTSQNFSMVSSDSPAWAERPGRTVQ